jgi:hypothetical protein
VVDRDACPDAHQPPTALAEISLPTLAEISESPDDFLGKLDVGTLNLKCAEGLPGAEDLDVPKQQAWLDEAARQVDLQTRARFEEFTRNPGAFDNSLGHFCCHYLLRTLQELLGVKYNPARVTDSDFQNPLCINPDFRDARDLFIHGMMGGPGGTCASMPVLYVAVGRRRGYPLKLVEAPGHLFFRWDDPEGKRFGVPEVLNVEGAGDGIGFYPDDFYRTWPREWRPIEENSGCYLKSLSPAEELAGFLATRGSCLKDNGRLEEATQSFIWATQLVPDDPRYHSEVGRLLKVGYETGLKALESERRALESQRRMLEMEQMRLEQKVRHMENSPAHSAHSSGPPHGDTCQCFQCRQTRQAMQQTKTPGHPPGCGCVSCQRIKSNPFSPW